MIEIRSLKIVKKVKYEERIGNPSYYYGMAIVDSKDKDYYFSPIYPFAVNNDIDGLIEFVSLYEEELLDFYKSGNRLYFVDYMFRFDTELKSRFVERWFDKGVIIN